MTKTLGPF